MQKEYFNKVAEYGQLIVVSGPSGVGKKTIIKEYLKDHPNAIRCTSITTRPQRPDEVDGVDYYFVSHEEFDQLIRSNQMLEFGYYRRNGYGTIRNAVEQLRQQGRNVILDIDVVGAMKVRTICPDATLVFLIPPTWEELETRIHNSKFIPESEIAERLEIAKEEIVCAEQYDYILINDTIDDTVHHLAEIIHGNRYSKNSMKSFLKSYIESEINSELVDVIRAL
ncbi:MAG: guanylate kinase [Oscillospiraceae bacterium]|nr:guanylate kinase [Oscillospiraceae bacterium]